MIKGVIFDLDGVILDSLGIWKDLGVRYLKSLDIVPEEGLSEILFPMSLEEGAGYLKEHYPVTKTFEEICADLQQLIVSFYFEEVLLKDGAAELVRFLTENKVKITSATSSPSTHAELALKRNGIFYYFEKILTTGEVGESKYSPEIYLRCADEMGLQPSEILVFEDSLYALKTAKAAGFWTAGVFDALGEPDQDALKEESDIYLNSMKDAIGAFKNLPGIPVFFAGINSL